MEWLGKVFLSVGLLVSILSIFFLCPAMAKAAKKIIIYKRW